MSNGITSLQDPGEEDFIWSFQWMNMEASSYWVKPLRVNLELLTMTVMDKQSYVRAWVIYSLSLYDV